MGSTKRQRSLITRICPLILSGITFLGFLIFLATEEYAIDRQHKQTPVNAGKFVKLKLQTGSLRKDVGRNGNTFNASGDSTHSSGQTRGNPSKEQKNGSDKDNAAIGVSLIDVSSSYNSSSKIEWPPIQWNPSNPSYQSLLSTLTAWNPDNPDPPKSFRETLQHFNYSDPYEREIARKYRDEEIPFKLYDVPEVNRVVKLWTDEYLKKQYVTPHVEKSANNHFMFWKPKKLDPNYVPPTTVVSDITFDKWLQLAHQADEKKLESEAEHVYFMLSANSHKGSNNFISTDLDIFSTNEDNFFISNVDANKGIQCRFSMRGIIAEAHYDSGKNMVGMLKGAKSTIDWSNLDEAARKGFDNVSAIDTILKEGEILYIPSFWFHYIVSLKYSIQCNSRSGFPKLKQGRSDIENCMHLK